jgi:hypothetical protein
MYNEIIEGGSGMQSGKTANSMPQFSNSRGYRVWLIRFALLLGIPVLLYYGYCWGIWGRNILLMQYLFQCNCPPASEETRYPDNVDVIIPACRNINVSTRLSPSGRFLYVREENQGLASAYLLDLQTMERIDVTDQSFSSFLTDDLWFIESGLEDYIMDRITGLQYPIQTFRHWRENAYVNGEPNLDLLVSALHQAEQTFFTRDNDTVIVLISNFPRNLEQSFTFDRSEISGGDSNKVEQFLQENNIDYQIVFANFPHEVVSPGERFIARDDGIYLIDTNQMIAKAPPSLVRGWTSDGRGVIYSSSGRCLIQIGLPFADDTSCSINVPQPVLLLKVPEEYLITTPTP